MYSFQFSHVAQLVLCKLRQDTRRFEVVHSPRQFPRTDAQFSMVSSMTNCRGHGTIALFYETAARSHAGTHGDGAAASKGMTTTRLPPRAP
jgi:hypothetical protein